MINAYIGVTDNDWYNVLRLQSDLQEAVFWQPSGTTHFRALRNGELFLFKLHSPNNFIVGGGIFAHFSLLPISLAWESFKVSNGAHSYLEMRKRVEKYRKVEANRIEDYTLGCIILEEPFFFDRSDWIPIPSDWAPGIVRGKKYDLATHPGRDIWNEVQNLLTAKRIVVSEESSLPAYGAPQLIHPRLGQGAFRVMITDGYQRRCAFTGERTLPALDAAHIRPYSDTQMHQTSNGLLLRKDLHALFDTGYMTVTSDYKIEVSRRIKEEFDNGKDYYRLHGTEIRMPGKLIEKPDPQLLVWHNENVFRS